jgi:hypothetical protein
MNFVLGSDDVQLPQAFIHPEPGIHLGQDLWLMGRQIVWFSRSRAFSHDTQA